MDPIVEIPCAEEIIHVGLFSLGSHKSQGFHSSGFTRGTLARSVKSDNPGSQFRRTAMEVVTRKVEDDVEVGVVKERSLTDADKTQKNSAKSDTKGRSKQVRLTDEGSVSLKKSGKSGSPRETVSEGWIQHHQPSILLQTSSEDLHPCQRKESIPAMQNRFLRLNPSVTCALENTHQMEVGLSAQVLVHSKFKKGPCFVEDKPYMNMGPSINKTAQAVLNRGVSLKGDRSDLGTARIRTGS